MTPSTARTDDTFARQLEIFRVEAESGAQFFYSYLAVHELAKRQRRVFRLLDRDALFWNTLLGGAQTGAIMTLGRIFDHRSPHNINTLIRLMNQHRGVFSKPALGRRKQGNDPQPPAWLPEYLCTAYEPTNADFRRIADYVKKYRRIYEAKYREVRNQLYAHKQAADPASIATLVKGTSIKEMERVFTFLLQLHQALQELFVNGRKPVLRPVRYSAQRISRRPSRTIHGDSVHERISMYAERALLGIAEQRKKPNRQRKP
ncbi:MAG: hypothetical protein ABSC23_09545 [Bryobacteraceae bacterium]|jgi:hypothetical protein